MFIGTFHHTLDAKNRVTVPRKILEKVRKEEGILKFYLCNGMDKCLFLFTESSWTDVTRAIEQLSLGQLEARDFQRLFFSDSYEVEVDGSGRILVPETLRRECGIDREVVFIGAGSRVEIWDAKRWDERKQKIAEEYVAIASKLLSPTPRE